MGGGKDIHEGTKLWENIKSLTSERELEALYQLRYVKEFEKMDFLEYNEWKHENLKEDMEHIENEIKMVNFMIDKLEKKFGITWSGSEKRALKHINQIPKPRYLHHFAFDGQDVSSHKAIDKLFNGMYSVKKNIHKDDDRIVEVHCGNKKFENKLKMAWGRVLKESNSTIDNRFLQKDLYKEKDHNISENFAKHDKNLLFKETTKMLTKLGDFHSINIGNNIGVMPPVRVDTVPAPPPLKRLEESKKRKLEKFKEGKENKGQKNKRKLDEDQKDATGNARKKTKTSTMLKYYAPPVFPYPHPELQLMVDNLKLFFDEQVKNGEWRDMPLDFDYLKSYVNQGCSRIDDMNILIRENFKLLIRKRVDVNAYENLRKKYLQYTEIYMTYPSTDNFNISDKLLLDIMKSLDLIDEMKKDMDILLNQEESFKTEKEERYETFKSLAKPVVMMTMNSIIKVDIDQFFEQIINEHEDMIYSFYEFDFENPLLFIKRALLDTKQSLRYLNKEKKKNGMPFDFDEWNKLVEEFTTEFLLSMDISKESIELVFGFNSIFNDQYFDDMKKKYSPIDIKKFNPKKKSVDFKIKAAQPGTKKAEPKSELEEEFEEIDENDTERIKVLNEDKQKKNTENLKKKAEGTGFSGFFKNAYNGVADYFRSRSLFENILNVASIGFTIYATFKICKSYSNDIAPVETVYIPTDLKNINYTSLNEILKNKKHRALFNVLRDINNWRIKTYGDQNYKFFENYKFNSENFDIVLKNLILQAGETDRQLVEGELKNFYNEMEHAIEDFDEKISGQEFKQAFSYLDESKTKSIIGGIDEKKTKLHSLTGTGTNPESQNKGTSLLDTSRNATKGLIIKEEIEIHKRALGGIKILNDLITEGVQSTGKQIFSTMSKLLSGDQIEFLKYIISDTSSKEKRVNIFISMIKQTRKYFITQNNVIAQKEIDKMFGLDTINIDENTKIGNLTISEIVRLDPTNEIFNDRKILATYLNFAKIIEQKGGNDIIITEILNRQALSNRERVKDLSDLQADLDKTKKAFKDEKFEKLNKAKVDLSTTRSKIMKNEETLNGIKTNVNDRLAANKIISTSISTLQSIKSLLGFDYKIFKLGTAASQYIFRDKLNWTGFGSGLATFGTGALINVFMGWTGLNFAEALFGIFTQWYSAYYSAIPIATTATLLSFIITSILHHYMIDISTPVLKGTIKSILDYVGLKGDSWLFSGIHFVGNVAKLFNIASVIIAFMRFSPIGSVISSVALGGLFVAYNWYKSNSTAAIGLGFSDLFNNMGTALASLWNFGSSWDLNDGAQALGSIQTIATSPEQLNALVHTIRIIKFVVPTNKNVMNIANVKFRTVGGKFRMAIEIASFVMNPVSTFLRLLNDYRNYKKELEEKKNPSKKKEKEEEINSYIRRITYGATALTFGTRNMILDKIIHYYIMQFLASYFNQSNPETILYAVNEETENTELVVDLITNTYSHSNDSIINEIPPVETNATISNVYTTFDEIKTIWSSQGNITESLENDIMEYIEEYKEGQDLLTQGSLALISNAISNLESQTKK